MQTSKEMAKMLNDTVWYFPRPSIKYDRDIGTYVSYDIAAYDCFERDILEIVLDVTVDRVKALSMCEQFNKYNLSLIHLKEAILDILE